MNCVFCKIIAGEIPARKIVESASAIAIVDAQPQAKKHFLIIPKKHIESLAVLYQSDNASPVGNDRGSSGLGGGALAIVQELYALAGELVRQEKLLPDGFRTVINTNDHGGQSVAHLHLHVLGGEKLKGSFGS